MRKKKKDIWDDFKCVDCSTNTHAIDEYYMVKDPVWKEAGMTKGMLCIGCLETRLRRELTFEDFTPAPINLVGVFFKQSKRLYDRLRGSYLDTHPLPRKALEA